MLLYNFHVSHTLVRSYYSCLGLVVGHAVVQPNDPSSISEIDMVLILKWLYAFLVGVETGK